MVLSLFFVGKKKGIDINFFVTILLFWQFITFAVLVAVANAGLLPVPAPAAIVHQPAAIVQQRYIQQAPLVQQYATPVLAKQVDDQYDPNPQYSYGYDIHDTLTGDAKSQQETRSGDVVQGRYSL